MANHNLNFFFDEDYTQTDPIELARLECHLGELAYLLNKESKTTFAIIDPLLKALQKEVST